MQQVLLLPFVSVRGPPGVLAGAEYVVLDDLNNGGQKPVQIRFYGTDTRVLMAMTEDFMQRLRKVQQVAGTGVQCRAPLQADLRLAEVPE